MRNLNGCVKMKDVTTNGFGGDSWQQEGHTILNGSCEITDGSLNGSYYLNDTGVLKKRTVHSKQAHLKEHHPMHFAETETRIKVKFTVFFVVCLLFNNVLDKFL